MKLPCNTAYILFTTFNCFHQSQTFCPSFWWRNINLLQKSRWPHADREQQVAGTGRSTPYAIVWATQICRNVETAVGLRSARPLPFFRHHSCYNRHRAFSHGCSVVTVYGSVFCLASCQSDSVEGRLCAWPGYNALLPNLKKLKWAWVTNVILWNDVTAVQTFGRLAVW